MPRKRKDLSGPETQHKGTWKNVKIEAFSERLVAYPDQSCLVVYLYRCLPVIDHRRVNIKTNYIEKLTEFHEPVLDRVRREHGPGRYYATANDLNRKPVTMFMRSLEFDVFDTEALPKIPDWHAVVPDDPRNSGWIEQAKRHGVWPNSHSKESEMAEVTATQEAVKQLGDVNQKLLGLAMGRGMNLEDVAKQIEAIRKLAPDPSEQLKLMLGFLKELRGENRGGSDDAILLILKETQATNRMLMEKVLGQQQQQPQQKPADYLREMKDMAETLGFNRDSGTGRGWMDLAAAVFQGLPDIIREGRGLFRDAMMSSAPPSSAASAVVDTRPVPTPPPSPAPQEQQQMLIAKIQAVARAALKNFETDALDGDAFASMLVNTWDDGEMLYGAITQAPPEEIVNRLLTFRPDLAGRRDELLKWIGEFVAFGQDEGETAGEGSAS